MRRPRAAAASGRRGAAAGGSSYTPGRVETIDLLEQRRLLPAIVFIFSRNQCDEAARVVPRRRAAPDRRPTSATASGRSSPPASTGSADDDLAVLGYGQFLAQLEAGIAAHHAGMVPAFKEAVEACFVEGLIKAVFATETLAVGINMPARTVVIEKLTKFTGDHHEMLTPGEYTQLTGRAGRRGIDDEGHAVVLWSPFVPFEQVAALAASRTFHLRSAFRPTYNMAANLVGTYTSEQAHHLLNLSFAQYQSDRDVVRLEARLERVRAELGAARERRREPVRRHLGVPPLARRDPQPRAGAATTSIAVGMARLRPGEVVHASKGRYRGPVAVVASAHRKGGMRLTTVTHAGRPAAADAGRLRRRAPLDRHRAAADGVQPEPGRVPPARSPGRSSGDHAAPRRRRATRHRISDGAARRRVRSRAAPADAGRRAGRAPGARARRPQRRGSTATGSRWRASSTTCSTCWTAGATSTPTRGR